MIVFNNKKVLDYLKEIYPSQLTAEKANKSNHLANYLDHTFIIKDSGGKLSTKLYYDKRNDFDFHIVNFPFLSSNIHLAFLKMYTRITAHKISTMLLNMTILDISTSA